MAFTGITAAALLTIASMLFAAAKSKVIFEAEDGTIVTKQSFRVQKSPEDAGTKASGGKVMAIPKAPLGEKVKPDQVTYKVNIPADGFYVLWGRTYWTTGCGNSFSVKVEGYNDAVWTLGGDATYDVLHWVCLKDGDTPRKLKLRKGVVTITLVAKEPGVRADEFILTTDAETLPAGVYKPTPGALAK